MNITQRLRQMSPRDLAAFGIQDLAYIRPVLVEGKPRYAIHAADGSQLALAPSYELALATVRQNDMEAVGLH